MLGIPIAVYQNMRRTFHCFLSMSYSLTVDMAICISTMKNM